MTSSTTFSLGGDLTIHRLGFGAMRITGSGIWGEPKDADSARKVLRRAVELGVDFIDTADSYGPEVSERLIGEALAPYKKASSSPPKAASPARVPMSGSPSAVPNTCSRKSK